MKTILSILFFFLFFIALDIEKWLDYKNNELTQINLAQNENIKKLEQVSGVNRWLKKNMTSNLEKFPKDKDDASEKLIEFYDRYSDKFAFSIENYLEEDNLSWYMDVSFRLNREDIESIRELVTLRMENGFIKFQKFKVGTKTISGSLRIIQPLFKIYKEKKEEDLDPLARMILEEAR